MRVYKIDEPDHNCEPESRHWSTTLTDPRWRTITGLRVGDRVERLMQLYPRSVRRLGRWWPLVTHDMLGIGQEDVLLQARVTSGRVSAFTVWFPAGGV